MSGPAHAHDHTHGGPASRAGAQHLGRLWIAFGLVASVLVLEVVVGFLADSLALLSDAGHMATDAAGLGMALAAIHLASRGSRRSGRSFGWYRVEVFAGLGNAVLLLAVAVFVCWEAVRRLDDPSDVASGPVLVAAALGLVANLIAFRLLRPGAATSLNVRGAYLEVLADLIGSIGVIVGAMVIAVTDWTWVDPVVGAALGVWIVPRAWRLAAETLRVLGQAAPAGLDLDELAGSLAQVEGVVGVHDVHVWTLTSGMDVASAHLVVASESAVHGVLDRARVLLDQRYGLVHATLQVEPASHRGCDEISW